MWNTEGLWSIFVCVPFDIYVHVYLKTKVLHGPVLFCGLRKTFIENNQNFYHKVILMSRDMTKPVKRVAPSEDSDQPGHLPV